MALNSWRTYEEVARYLVGEFHEVFGLSRVEGKQILAGESGTTWEIDAKGVRQLDEAIIIIECRRYTRRRDNQKAVAGLAYTIKDACAGGGIHISPLGLQEGAQKIAAAENVLEVTLN